jgi:hypothetical protein
MDALISRDELAVLLAAAVRRVGSTAAFYDPFITSAVRPPDVAGRYLP